MNNDKSKSNEAIAGAVACIAALQKLEQSMETSSFDEDWQSYFEGKQRLVKEAAATAGELPPFATGFMLALVEYFHDTVEAGVPNMDKWKPEAAMTPVEVIISRAEFAALGSD